MIYTPSHVANFFLYQDCHNINCLQLNILVNEDEDTHKLLSKVWEVYGKLPMMKLVNIHMQSKNPWSKYYEEDSFYNIIPKKEIKEYYRDMINRAKNA